MNYIYEKNELKRSSIYEEYRRTLPVEKKTVFYHAYRTRLMAGNPYAIFKYLIEHEEYSDFRHYWVYTDEEEMEYDTFSRYKDLPNVFCVKAQSDEHLKAMATCEYLVENAAMPSYWYKRKDQVYINTWHGTPLKSLGKRALDSNKASISNAQRNFLMCDYMVMPNRYTTEKMLDSYDIDGLLTGKIIEAGYPRIDLVLNSDSQRIRDLLAKRSGLDLTGKKIALYAPTFRSKEGVSLNSSDEMVSYIEEIQARLPEDYVLFFKAHNTIGKFFKNREDISKLFLTDELETNELLSAVDVLITDYSSIFYDFICTGRPILYFAYDREEYETGHGMYVSMDELPGAICYDVDGLIGELEKILTGDYVYNNREKSVADYAYCDDGSATRRVVDIIMHGKGTEYIYEPEKKPLENILLSLSDEAKASHIELLYRVLEKIDQTKYRPVIACSLIDYISTRCEEIAPESRVLASKMLLGTTEEDRKAGKLPDEVIEDQYNKYFSGLDFTTYIDFKFKENVADILLQDRVPVSNRYNMLNGSQNLYDTIKKDKRKYNKGYMVCNDVQMPEIPAWVRSKYEIIDSNIFNSKDPSSLNILIIGTFDSMNSVLAPVAMELKARGHRVIVVVKDKYDDINNKIFIRRGINYYEIDDVDPSAMKYIDVVLTAPTQFVAYRKLLSAIDASKVMTFSFMTLFSSVLMKTRADIVFTIGSCKFDEFKKYSLDYRCMAIGNPQYDALVPYRRKTQGEVKKVLIVDQGGYPYGTVGKQQLADTITRIARMNPDMEFRIKPRYIKGERGTTVHKVSEHLSDFITEWPDNLSEYEVPTILEELLPEYDAMITTWSTALLEAIVINMPLLLISGLTSTDVFDVRKQRVEEAYDNLRGTGCVYDYSELGDLTGKFRLVDPEYAAAAIYKSDETCADKIANVVEKCYAEMTLKNRQPDKIMNVTYDDFMADPGIFGYKPIDPERDNMDKVAIRRFNFFLQECVYINRCMGNVLDLTPLTAIYEDVRKVNERDDFEKVMPKWQELFEKIRSDFFKSAEGQKKINEDIILQDFYFDWLYNTKQYKKIRNFSGNLLAKVSYDYYQALINLPVRKHKAFEYLMKYFDDIEANEVTQTLKERRVEVMSRPFKTGINKPLWYYYLMRDNRAMMIQGFDSKKMRRNTFYELVRMRDFNRRGMYDDAIETYEQYDEMYRKKLKKGSKTLKGKFRLVVKKQLQASLEKELETAKKGKENE